MATETRRKVWMIEVNRKGRKGWSPTGVDWYFTQRTCLKGIASIFPDNLKIYNYRAAKYVAEGRVSR